MSQSHREEVRDLLRRIDDVRGLSESSQRGPIDPGDPSDWMRTTAELVDELERSHRRLIETNVQLVSLREVASSMVTATDASETTRTVTRYLARAFGFGDAFLLLVGRERGTLAGTWTHGVGEGERTFRLELPLLGDRGGVTRSLWLNRTVLLRDPERHPSLLLPDGHALHDVLGGIGSIACVPLQRSYSGLPEPHELCGARCILGDVSLLAPPPGAAAEGWAVDRDERQGNCLACEFMPILGVIGMARPSTDVSLGPADVTLLESIAHSVAPIVENARLYYELRRSERFRLHVLDSMASALVVVSMKGEILTFNRAAQELLGFHEAEVSGKRQLRSDLLRQLAARVTFDLPSSLVDREIDRRLEEFARRLTEQRIDPREANIDWAQFREGQREAAREAVASALVLDELARRETLTVLPEDVDKEIEQFATRAGRTPAAIRAQLEKDGGISRLYAGLRREKAVDFAMSRAKMTPE